MNYAKQATIPCFGGYLDGQFITPIRDSQGMTRPFYKFAIPNFSPVVSIRELYLRGPTKDHAYFEIETYQLHVFFYRSKYWEIYVCIGYDIPDTKFTRRVFKRQIALETLERLRKRFGIRPKTIYVGEKQFGPTGVEKTEVRMKREKPRISYRSYP